VLGIPPRRGEERVVHVGEYAAGRVRRQVGGEPRLLGRALPATADLVAARVERDHVPATEVVAVVALPALAGGPAGDPGAVPVVEVGVGAGLAVLLVARDRMAERREAAPRRVVGGAEGRGGGVFVLEVAQRQHRRQAPPDHEVGRGHLAAGARGAGAAVEERGVRVAGYVAGGGYHRVIGRARGHDELRRLG